MCDNFVLQTDASSTGVGAVLNVRREDVDYPVAYYSRKLQPRERRYAATELEGLAVVDAVQHFSPYLVSKPFIIETDHKALTSIQTARHENARIARWAYKLQPFSFSVIYRTGAANSNADALSRQYDEEKKGEML